MDISQSEIIESFPFVSVLLYGGNEYIGIIINQDKNVISFYNLGSIRTSSDLSAIIEIGETWWWETDRIVPISIKYNQQLRPFSYSVMTVISKDTKITHGPTVQITDPTGKRPKRNTINLKVRL